MPAPESNGRYQQVIYWEANGVDNYGKAKVDAGRELTVRWEPNRRLVNTAQGKTLQLDISMFVDEDLVEGSIVWFGTIDDLPDPVSTVTSLYEIVSFQITPDIKGREFQRTAMLRKFRDSLPTINS